MKKLAQRLLGGVTAAVTMLSALTLFPAPAANTVSAISTDYPPVFMNIAAKDNATVLTENGTADGASLSAAALGGTLAPSWRFDRVGADGNGTYFKLCNAESGRLLTPKGCSVQAGNAVIMYGSESKQCQHWFVVPVSQDRLGNDLCYKIVNYSDPTLALTRSSAGMTLESYSGADSQLWLLNPDGAQGFAGYCANDNTGSVKAADIGGLFGEIVEANNFNDLKKYAASTTPYTIVVNGNISVSSLTKDSSGRYYCPDGRIYVEGKKTIIGSYSAHTLNNVALLTNRSSSTCSNIIIKNFDFQHAVDANGNDNITVYFSAGQNLWLDHCTFTGHPDYNKASTGLEDYDKFFACCYNADYCTVSDCSFGLHEYGLILGYPDDTAEVKNQYDNFPRMSIIGNRFYKTLTRGPGLMRWGYFHSLCNYVNTFSMAYTVHSGCDIYAENCCYENGGNVICDWNSITYAGAYAESGSVFSNCNRTVQGQGTASNPSYSQPSAWRPKNNYSYVSVSGDQTKNYCNAASGCQSQSSAVRYLRYANAGVPSAGYTEAPNGKLGETFADGSAFMLKNVNSGLYLTVSDDTAANGSNIFQQRAQGEGANGEDPWNVWRLYAAEDGYYYIYSACGDGKTYVLDVAGKKTDDGTNIDLYQQNGGDNQQFKLVKNNDGSYKIYTKISADGSVVEVASGSTEAGANVQQWSDNGYNCQDWELIPAVLPINGVLVKALGVLDSEHAAAYGIAYNAASGSRIFGDRDFTVTDLPAVLSGAEQILTACDSKFCDSDLAQFTAGDDITVYIALDTRVPSVPAWLSAYTLTEQTVSTSNDVTLRLYAADFSAGERITLGTNGGSSSVVNYAVFVTKQPEVTTTTTTTTTTETTTTTTTTTATETTTPPIIPQRLIWGDADCSGDFALADCVLLAKAVVGISGSELTVGGKANCDLYADGKIDSSDMSVALQLMAGICLNADMPISPQ